MKVSHQRFSHGSRTLTYARVRLSGFITSSWMETVRPFDRSLQGHQVPSPLVNSLKPHFWPLSVPSKSRRALRRGLCTLVDHSQMAATGSFAGSCTMYADTAMAATRRRLNQGSFTMMMISTRGDPVSDGSPSCALAVAFLTYHRSIRWWCWWNRRCWQILRHCQERSSFSWEVEMSCRTCLLLHLGGCGR